MFELEHARRVPGNPTSRLDLGLEHTFTADGFATFRLQSILLTYVRAQAESLMVLAGRNTLVSTEGHADIAF